MGSSHTFKKSERLIQRKLIEDIFNKKGKSIHAKPLLFVYLEHENDGPYPAQILISVSKRKFKRAHDRNRIKRVMKEAYRLQKHKIYSALENSNKQFALALLYLSSEPANFNEIEKKLNDAIEEFIKRIS